jgi:hypothetical protein
MRSVHQRTTVFRFTLSRTPDSGVETTPCAVRGRHALSLPRRLDEHVHARSIAERNNIYMSDFPNDDLRTEPVSGLADLQQNSHNGNCGLNIPIRGAFQDRLMEYRNRLAKVLQDEATDTRNG